MNTIVYEETLTGRTHDTSVQKATSDNEIWMQFNVMPWTSLGVDVIDNECRVCSGSLYYIMSVEYVQVAYIILHLNI